jgi:hypothetical protein
MALCFCLLPGSVLHADDQYLIKFNEALDKVDVRACFEGKPPERIYREERADKHTLWIRNDQDSELNVRSRNGTIRLPSLPDNSCINWRVDLSSAVAVDEYRFAFRMGGSLVTSADLWFWRDGDKRQITAEVHLPKDMSFSTPWAHINDSDNGLTTKYRPDQTPASWSSRIAVGHFPINKISTDGGIVNLATVGDLTRSQRQKFTRWIEHTSTSLNSVYGRFPRQRTQVLIVPIGDRGEKRGSAQAVPWAHVVRGGGVGIEFFVDETRPLQDLEDDWTATHEFSHLLLPFISGDDRWLSEGLASYYQNVLRARNGRLSEEEAWEKLHQGFERGRNGSYRGTLASASDSGYGATMRIYWSGAAMMLKADAELRKRSDGKQSLDTALAQLQTCCLTKDRMRNRKWGASELFSQLDKLTGTTVFQELYDEHVYDRDFPDVSKTFTQLGVKTDTSEVRIEPGAPWARIRYFIMNG